MKREDCFIDATGIDPNMLLQSWRWLTGLGEFTILKVTAGGDAFLKDVHGHVFFLDVRKGQFTQIAESESDFSEKLNVRANRDQWLSAHFIQLAGGGRPALGRGQCWGWKIPFFLGGKVERENAEPSDLIAYHSILGQLFQQARDKQ